MNSWLILLLLLFGNLNCCNNYDDSDYGYGSDRAQGRYRSSEKGWDGDRNGDFEREYGRGRDCDDDRNDDDDSCGCNNNNNESRFEPRFDARPFSNPDCGCDNQ